MAFDREQRRQELRRQRADYVQQVNGIDGYLQCLDEMDAAERAAPVVDPSATIKTAPSALRLAKE